MYTVKNLTHSTVSEESLQVMGDCSLVAVYGGAYTSKLSGIAVCGHTLSPLTSEHEFMFDSPLPWIAFPNRIAKTNTYIIYVWNNQVLSVSKVI